jgi:hypothetical protein
VINAETGQMESIRDQMSGHANNRADEIDPDLLPAFLVYAEAFISPSSPLGP